MKKHSAPFNAYASSFYLFQSGSFYGKQSVLTTLQFDGEIVVPKDLNNSELEKKILEQQVICLEPSLKKFY